MTIPKLSRRSDTVCWTIAAVSLLSLAIFSYRWSRNGFFWDLAVYRRAVADYHRNLDPYRADVFFPFVYHPLVLRLFSFLNSIVPLKASLPLLEVAALASFAFEFVRTRLAVEMPGRCREPKILAAAAAGAFGGIGVPALMSGNVASFMHFALIASLLHSRRVASGPSVYLPYGLILLFALIKPYFLIFLALPILLSQGRVMTAVACSAVVALVFAAAWLSFDLFRPVEFSHFIDALRSATLGSGDLGYTFFGSFAAMINNYLVALALHAVLCTLLIAVVLLLFEKRYGREAQTSPWIFVTYLLLTLANPRMKDYDLFPALIGFIAVFGLAPKRAALGTLAALLLSLVPLLGPALPDLSARHPALFDPYGNWQDVGLIVIGMVFVAGMLEGDRATALPTGRLEASARPTTEIDETDGT